MNRYIYCIAILLALGVQTQWQTLLWVTYYADTDLFALNCENPENACCVGKCQVEKAETTRQESNTVIVRSAPLQPCIITTNISFPIREKQLTAHPLTDVSLLYGYTELPDKPPRA